MEQHSSAVSVCKQDVIMLVIEVRLASYALSFMHRAKSTAFLDTSIQGIMIYCLYSHSLCEV